MAVWNNGWDSLIGYVRFRSHVSCECQFYTMVSVSAMAA
jgi:hypothetical protein